jgi:hypothetical protein
VQEDCQVSLNTVDDVDTFLADINNGRWDAVLPQITRLRLPTAKLFDLYEQVVLEMIELREAETARVMLRTMKVFRKLQMEDPERFLRLEKLCSQCGPCCSFCEFNSTMAGLSGLLVGHQSQKFAVWYPDTHCTCILQVLAPPLQHDALTCKKPHPCCSFGDGAGALIPAVRTALTTWQMTGPKFLACCSYFSAVVSCEPAAYQSVDNGGLGPHGSSHLPSTRALDLHGDCTLPSRSTQHAHTSA